MNHSCQAIIVREILQTQSRDTASKNQTNIGTFTKATVVCRRFSPPSPNLLKCVNERVFQFLFDFQPGGRNHNITQCRGWLAHRQLDHRVLYLCS